MELHEIVTKYWQGLINYYDALEMIIEHRGFGENIVAIDDSIKAIQPKDKK